MTQQVADRATWPEPYLQPDRTQDCGYYAAAYLARCLGRPETTAEQVKAWRARTSCHETQYARRVLGAEMRTFWDEDDVVSLETSSEERRKWFWLGPELQGWVTGWLFTGWIAQVMLHRIAPMGHAAVVLGCSDEGVQLMDPIYGHTTEPWGWFLGPGAGTRKDWGAAPDGRPFYGCHFIEGWYRMPSQEVSV